MTISSPPISFKEFLRRSDKSIQQYAEVFRCIGDPTCLKLLSLLFKNEELCVSDLTSSLKVSMPAVSHQLKKLRSLGLLNRKRDGQMICYSLAKNGETRKLKRIISEVI